MFELIEFIHRMNDRYPGRLSLATSDEQAGDVFATGNAASLLRARGRSLRVRYLTLTHSKNTS